MDIDEIQLETSEGMDRALEYLQKELRGMRTGRANTALLEYVKVEYYGSNTDLRELAKQRAQKRGKLIEVVAESEERVRKGSPTSAPSSR